MNDEDYVLVDCESVGPTGRYVWGVMRVPKSFFSVTFFERDGQTKQALCDRFSEMIRFGETDE